MQSIWEFVKRPVIAETLVLGAIVGAGLAMDRWWTATRVLLRTWEAEAWAILLPLLGWSFAVLLLFAFVVWLPRRRRVILASGFILIGVGCLVLSFSAGRNLGASLTYKLFPRFVSDYVLQSSIWHVMSLRLARQLLWIGSFGLLFHPVSRWCLRDRRMCRASLCLGLSLIIAVGLHLLFDSFLQYRLGGSGIGSPGWLAEHLGSIREIVFSCSTMGAWMLVLAVSRVRKVFALPWFLVGLAMAAVYLLSAGPMLARGAIRGLYLDAAFVYGNFTLPWAVATMLGIGTLGFILGGLRDQDRAVEPDSEHSLRREEVLDPPNEPSHAPTVSSE